MDFASGAKIINAMIALILSLTFREAAQALVAKFLGDRTAENDGRLTLNPIPHLDPMGSLVFPFIFLVIGGMGYGWAKPIPVDSRNFKNAKSGIITVAFTGPVANLLLTFLSLVIYYAIGDVPESSPLIAFSRLMQAMTMINALLAIFNMIPIPPMDGGTIVYELLPYEGKRWYDQYIVPYGFFILLGVGLLGGFRFVQVLSGLWIGICETVVRGMFA